MDAAASVPSIKYVDDINPDENTSSVSLETNTNTIDVEKLRQQTAFTAKQVQETKTTSIQAINV